MQKIKYVKLPCKICGSSNLRHLFTKIDTSNSLKKPIQLHISKCRECGLIGANPRLENIGAIYNEQYYEHEFRLLDKKFEESRINAAVRAFHMIEKNTGRKAGKIIDLGCGSGTFLNGVLKAEHNWEIHGLDMKNCLRGPAKKSVKFHKCSIENISKLKEKFDLATMIEVAEHLTEPTHTFKAIHESLNQGGWLFISTANLESVLSRIRGPKETYYKAAHVAYWSPKSVRTCLEKCGFKVKKITTMHNGNWQLFRDTKKAPYLFTALYLEILNRLHFGDTFLLGGMNVFAQKVKK